MKGKSLKNRIDMLVERIQNKSSRIEKLRIITISSFFFLVILAGLSAAYDLGYVKSDRGVGFILSQFCPASKDNIVNAFNGLWSVAVTVTIFVLEFSERYKYGVPLKHIVYEAIGRNCLFGGAIMFLLLFPLFYIFMKFSLMQLGVWCLCAGFVMFTETIAFFAWLYKGQHMRDVIRIKTLEQIEKLATKRESLNDTRYEAIQLHGQIDSLMISNMLEHTDYGNVDEVNGLVGVCQGIFQTPQLWEALKKSMLENLIITTWVDHIIHSCKWNTEYDCTQNISTLRSLWKGIVSTISRWDIEISNRAISVSLQFLQPFVNENNVRNDQLLVRMWRELGMYREQVLVYLLLYTTYRVYRLESVEYLWPMRDEYAFRVCMRMIIEGHFRWNEYFAMQCWIDWFRYDCRQDIDLTQFMRFSNDIRSLQEGKRYEVKSPVLAQAVGGIV